MFRNGRSRAADGPRTAAEDGRTSAAATGGRDRRRTGGVRSRPPASTRPSARNDRRRQGGQLLERRDPSGKRGREIRRGGQQPDEECGWNSDSEVIERGD